MCKRYRQTPHQVFDANGNSRILQDRAEVFATHYATAQWNTAELPALPDRPALFPHWDLPCGRFSPYELRQVRARLKKRKMHGTDFLSNEIICLVLDTDWGSSYILELMNLCWTQCTMPQLWQLARIVAIYKNEGATTLPQNYRPIALLQAMYKIFTSLIERRLRVLEPHLWKMQQGYHSGHNTDDANHLLLRAIELTLRWQGLPLYLFCLDWKKCYDRIHIDRLLKALQRFRLPDHYLQILRMI